MIWVALGGLALLGVLALARGFASARVDTLKTLLAWIGGGFLVVLVLVFVLSGRAAQAIWAAVLLGPLAWREVRRIRAARRFGQPQQAAGADSTVETATLAMTLDHASGRMSGRVRRGPQAGRELADLPLPALLALLDGCRGDDPDSVPLLEAWLDRAFPDWRATRAGPEAPSSGMTRAEALAILGLAEGATPRQIKAAHRRLMAAAHPDHGGSDWLAARINQARDRLLD